MKFIKYVTTSKELVDHVLEEYRRCDAELNSLYFDFRVKMKKADILTAYAELQDIINGDAVVHLEGDKEADKLIPEGMYEDIYEGSCKDFLESLNDGNVFARFDDDERLEFIF
ncbi:hypothetical protein [Butyrivibrio proteoclasticus]|uniref:hypothetical protein n=1 Tax=Butyrivibrio proteoclasticus TaxID=43305 RepID=UPI00047ED914|nr:hypothetical protein [Butyrivibrio proteoclasticus]